MPADSSRFLEPVLSFARTDVPLLQQAMTVAEALAVIRERGVEERIVYFYVVDEEGRLAGVLPTRRLLTASLDGCLTEVMIRRVLAVPKTATLIEACELFVLHKFLAFPIVDAERRVVGVLDITVFTEEVLEMPEEAQRTDELFEVIGMHMAQAHGASPLKAFKYRFPWLLTTIGSGTAAAMIASAFEETLQRQIIIACFLALVLALAEAVSMQSMTLTLQALRARRPTLRWFWAEARREVVSALLLGSASGGLVFALTWVWRGELVPAAVIGTSVAGALVIACVSGLGMPSLLHALKLDPKIAAGPASLAVTDVATLLLYLFLADWVL